MLQIYAKSTHENLNKWLDRSIPLYTGMTRRNHPAREKVEAIKKKLITTD